MSTDAKKAAAAAFVLVEYGYEHCFHSELRPLISPMRAAALALSRLVNQGSRAEGAIELLEDGNFALEAALVEAAIGKAGVMIVAGRRVLIQLPYFWEEGHPGPEIIQLGEEHLLNQRASEQAEGIRRLKTHLAQMEDDYFSARDLLRQADTLNAHLQLAMLWLREELGVTMWQGGVCCYCQVPQSEAARHEPGCVGAILLDLPIREERLFND